MKNEIFEVKIIENNNLGHGIAKVDNKVIFVQNAVADDVLEIKIIKEAKNYSVARIEKIIMPSPFRKESDCAISKRCGGCIFRNMTYEAELNTKKGFVKSALIRNGIKDFDLADTYPSPNVCHYRNKAQYPVGKDKNGDLFYGFYAEHSHDIIKIDACKNTPEIFDTIADHTVKYMQNLGVEPYFEANHKGILRHIYIRSSKDNKNIALCLVINADGIKGIEAFANEICEKFPQIKTVALNINKARTNVILGDEFRIISGEDKIFDEMCGIYVKYSLAAFYQINTPVAEALYQKAIELAELKNTDLAVDFYCGIGVIGMLAAKRAKSVIGIEIIDAAVENAKEIAKENGIDNISFICEDAKNADKILPENIDALFVDPPRKGIDPVLMGYIKKALPKKIVYVSCDENTFARDLAILTESGYTLGKIYPFDMFPATGHVECLTVLERG